MAEEVIKDVVGAAALSGIQHRLGSVITTLLGLAGIAVTTGLGLLLVGRALPHGPRTRGPRDARPGPAQQWHRPAAGRRVGTVKSHVGAILDKTGSSSRVQAALLAHQAGLANG